MTWRRRCRASSLRPIVLIYTAALAAVRGQSAGAPRPRPTGRRFPSMPAKGLEERVQMKMEHAGRSEFARLHRGMDVLASIASSTPFIGLFGTVLGIMSTFQVLGSAKSASLNVVAPGIAAALIATAAGLAVAIPAVFAYNSLMARMDELQEQSDMFTETLAQWLLSAGVFHHLPASHAHVARVQRAGGRRLRGTRARGDGISGRPSLGARALSRDVARRFRRIGPLNESVSPWQCRLAAKRAAGAGASRRSTSRRWST